MAVRARAAVADVCSAAEPRPGATHAAHAAGRSPEEPLQLFSEVAEPGREDAAVAAALHRGGRSTVAIGERLLTGEVRPCPSPFHPPLLCPPAALSLCLSAACPFCPFARARSAPGARAGTRACKQRWLGLLQPPVPRRWCPCLKAYTCESEMLRC